MQRVREPYVICSMCWPLLFVLRNKPLEKRVVIRLYTEQVEVDQFSELATLVLAPSTRRISQ